MIVREIETSRIISMEICLKCRRPDTRDGFDVDLRREYKLLVCTRCAVTHGREFKGIMKTDAKTKFCLTDSALATLPFASRPNPRNAAFAPHEALLHVAGSREESSDIR